MAKKKISAAVAAKLEKRIREEMPIDPWEAFAWVLSRSAQGFARELMEKGKTQTQARNAIIGCFLQCAAGEACRLARSEKRTPDPAKWRKATKGAFDKAVVYTAKRHKAKATTP